MKKWRAALLSLALIGCATPQRDITPAIMGSWGGDHIELIVGELDADVQFDCAEGAIFGPYSIKTDQTFEWPGTFTRGTGGPVRADEHSPPAQPALYYGRLNGPEMTLSAKLDDGTVIGPFNLERFRESKLTRCL
jgi:hypothetical protein